MKTMKKILSLALCFMLLVSAVPMHTFAAESTVTNGTYQDGVWTAGGTGTITHNINGTDIALSKTAVPVEGMENTYDITLRVETSTHESHVTAGGAVVLVIDESNSMDDCATCGAGWGEFHERGCPNESLFVNNYNETRMYAAQEAAKDFLKTYAGTDASANRMLAIVTFATRYNTELNWINVAGGAGKNGYNTALAAINGLATNGGTNLEGGLHQALQELGKDAIKGVDAPSVVLLTDGAPTYRINGGSGSSGSKENNDAAEAKATAIKNAGAEIYTVCFGAAGDETYRNGPTMGEFLKNSISSGSGFAYNANNANEVADAFESITEDIVEGLDGSGWTATDPMPAYIDVTGHVPGNFTSSNGQDYTWELSNPEVIKNGDDTTYIYTLTYRIELDVQVPGFVEGQYYPTNEPTTLNIGEEHYAFPVPGVKGVLPRTDVTVTKVWEDDNNRDGIRADSVTLQLQKDGADLGEPVVLSEENGWAYTWTDLIEMSGGVEHAYTVVEAEVKGYDPVYTVNGTALTVTNVHKNETKDITVTKVWNDNDDQDGIRPDSITAALLANGEQVATAKITAQDNWTYTFKGFLVNEGGEEIAYTVEELEVHEAYESSVEGLVITNTYTPATTTISGAKTWDDADDQDGLRPESILINLTANGTVKETKKVTAADNWAWTFENLPVYENGAQITYAIDEIEVEGYTTKVEGYNITNTHTPETLDISGTKTWEDDNNRDGIRPESITVNLMAAGEVVATATVTEAEQWSWTFTDLPKYAAGEEIEYTIAEMEVEGYYVNVDGYNLTNVYLPVLKDITVTKVWNDAENQDGKRPTSVEVQLLAGGEAYGEPVVLNEENKWSYTWENLYVNENGQEIVYTVAEVNVPDDYESSVKDFVITNTYEPETVTISGSKTWEDADNQDGIRPESITVNLKAGEEVVATATVTEAEKWTWNFTDLPKYANGTEIEYTIEEVAVEGYEATVNGYDIVNTHVPTTVHVEVKKVWNDNNDMYKIQPNSVTIVLVADGVETEKTLKLDASNGWAGRFTDLPEKANGVAIVYTVKELDVEGYGSTVTGNAADGFTVTNDLILIPETGDETNILVYGLVMGISFLALVGVLVLMISDKKRYRK